MCGGEAVVQEGEMCEILEWGRGLASPRTTWSGSEGEGSWRMYKWVYQWDFCQKILGA